MNITNAPVLTYILNATSLPIPDITGQTKWYL